MSRCRDARAFLHCSSTGVYEAADGTPQRETDPLGDNHRVMMPTYSIAKIAAEAVVRTTCRIFGVPTTIARLNVPYGDNGGWPAFHLALMLRRTAGARAPERPEPVQPDPRGRHHRDAARACSRPRSVPGDDRQLGRRRGDEHRGVVRVPGRARRHRAAVRRHRAHDRRDPDRQHEAARAGRRHHGRLEGRDAAAGRSEWSTLRSVRNCPPDRQYSPPSRSRNPSSTR